MENSVARNESESEESFDVGSFRRESSNRFLGGAASQLGRLPEFWRMENWLTLSHSQIVPATAA